MSYLYALAPLRLIFIGQTTLVVCTLFYLCWWYAAFRPHSDSHTLAGIKGAIFWLTALTGLVGIFFSAAGLHALPESPTVSVREICLGGVLAYGLLVGVTYGIFGRPLTAELVLIVAWAGLETSILQGLGAAGHLPPTCLFPVTIAIATATVIGLILYMLYYKLDEKIAFYVGMVPIILDGAIMGLIGCIIKLA